MTDARLTVSPLRRRLLDRLREPASAAQLATEWGLGRQRINYHLRALERAGLIELVEERRRRGCVERVLRIRSVASDRHAAERLVVAAGDVVRDVTRMQAAAAREGSRLLTFTIETELTFAEPADLERFADALAAAVGRLAGEFAAGARADADIDQDPVTSHHSGTGTGTGTGTATDAGRRYRLVAGMYPAPRPEETDS